MNETISDEYKCDFCGEQLKWNRVDGWHCNDMSCIGLR